MPCMDGREKQHDAMLQRLACEYLRLLESQGKPIPDYPGVREWWDVHKEYDRECGRM